MYQLILVSTLPSVQEMTCSRREVKHPKRQDRRIAAGLATQHKLYRDPPGVRRTNHAGRLYRRIATVANPPSKRGSLESINFRPSAGPS